MEFHCLGAATANTFLPDGFSLTYRVARQCLQNDLSAQRCYN